MSSLATRIGRIGTIFPVVNRLAIRDRFKSKCKTIKSTWFKHGVKIVAMTSISAGGMVGVTHEMTNSDPIIRDLEEVVKKRALYLYEADKEFSLRSFFQKEEPYIDLNWENVIIAPETSKCKEITGGEDVVVRASSETVLKNRSKIDQQHKLTTERETSSVCETSLKEGFSIGSTVGLSLKPTAAMDNLKSEIEIKTEFSLQHIQDSKAEEKDVWSVEDFVIVPRKSTITVCRQLNDNEKEYSFTTRIRVSGNVKATCYNKTKEITRVYNISMRTVIVEEFEPRMVEEEENDVFITVSGSFKLKKRVDEIIITPQKRNSKK